MPRFLCQIGSRDVGKLIGKGGATIRELRQKSGCQIEVGEEDTFDTEIFVFGKTRVNDRNLGLSSML
jgi:polyribonucleotide nucleotidyltransferase